MPMCARSDRKRHVADVDAVDQDCPGRHVVEPRQQVDQRRLARAAQPDDRDHLTGRDREGHIAQHEFAGASVSGIILVGKADVAELDRLPERRQRGRARPLGDLRMRVEHLEDALRRRDRLLQIRVHAAQTS